MDSLRLICPIRGELKAAARSSDGLTPSEEARRIEAIAFLLSKGYPKDRIKVEATVKRLGNQGRNSVRADVAALDVPVASINSGDVEALLEHAVLLAEIKRENKGAKAAKATQVEPLLDFAHLDDCVALYWDDTEQRVFWRERVKGKRVTHEAPASILPEFGRRIAVKELTLGDTEPTENLLTAFRRVEDILHGAAIDPEARYEIILQFLLTKLYDEQSHASAPDSPLSLQDYRALDTAPAIAEREANEALKRALAYYGRYLPQPVPSKFPLTAETLFAVLEILAPIRITGSSQEVMQTFYMHFAKHLYKWDLAQFFTPITLTDFIATALAPGFGEHVKDPACGSADFLTSAYRIGSRSDQNYGQAIWGADNSRNAVQVAVLNMMLNGDGKSNIVLEDSLAKVDFQEGQFDILICNPPFGTRIIEKRRDVLAKFALGHEWQVDDHGVPQQQEALRKTQQVGLLFAELCVRQVRPGGRVGLILPNGYLGNRGLQYRAFREWLLRHAKIASICSFPRFTFKTSGADVSASVIFLERMEKPLRDSSELPAHPVHIGMIDRVGWRLGDKKAKPEFRRDPEDGSYLVDENGRRVLDTEFERVLAEMRASSAGKVFGWLARESGSADSTEGWTVPSKTIVEDPYLTSDPKRLSEKASVLRDQLASRPHWELGELVNFIGQSKKTWLDSHIYRYVEIEDMSDGQYRWKSLRGWELPDRARHKANKGDIFLGSVWASVKKWMLAGSACDDLLVTNGCLRLAMKEEKIDFLVDLVAALVTDAYATQMRSLARGSDGLAEVAEEDVSTVLIPRLDDPARDQIRPFVDQLLTGHTGVRSVVDGMLESGDIDVPVPPKRPSHSVLV